MNNENIRNINKYYLTNSCVFIILRMERMCIINAKIKEEILKSGKGNK